MNLYVDELRPTWTRYYVEVDTESTEEAIELVKNGDYEVLESECLYDLVESQQPEALEIFDIHHNSLYSNL